MCHWRHFTFKKALLSSDWLQERACKPICTGWSPVGCCSTLTCITETTASCSKWLPSHLVLTLLWNKQEATLQNAARHAYTSAGFVHKVSPPHHLIESIEIQGYDSSCVMNKTGLGGVTSVIIRGYSRLKSVRHFLHMQASQPVRAARVSWAYGHKVDLFASFFSLWKHPTAKRVKSSTQQTFYNQQILFHAIRSSSED